MKRAMSARINRVHAPESDMHAILPLRDSLLASLNARPTRSARKRKRTLHPQTQLQKELQTQPAQLAQRLSTESSPAYTRAAILAALRSAPVEAVLPPIADVLAALPSSHVATVLDRVARMQTRAGNTHDACRTVRVARALDLRLSRGVYLGLMAVAATPDEAILHAHACLAAHPPNAAVLNALLAALVAAEDPRAARVVAEFARSGVRMNGFTRQLLGRTPAAVIVATAREDAAQAVLVLDRAVEAGVRIDGAVYDRVVVECVRQQRVEAALRVWRERRRAWLGGVGRQARWALVRGGVVTEGDGRWDVLLEGARDGEIRRLRRCAREVCVRDPPALR